MQRLYSMFPAGAPGCGLILLRSAVAWAALAQAHVDAAIATPQAGAALALAASLLLGAYTPLAAGLVIVQVLCGVAGDAFGAPAGLSIAVAMAVILLGPGAYSADAHRLGRRVVTLARRKP